MTRDSGPYSRFYWRFRDEFSDIYADKETFGWWITLLANAEGAHPSAPELPRRLKPRCLKQLIDADLVTLLPGDRYRMRGTAAEMDRRSNQGRAGADARWKRTQSDSNANALRSQSLDEQRRDETSREGADALDVWYRLTGSWPSPKVLPWLNELIDAHGDAAVADAIAVEWQANSDRKSILGRVQDTLSREAHEAEKRRQTARAQAAEEERRLIDSMPAEDKEANLARLRGLMVEKGLLS